MSHIYLYHITCR